MNDLLLAYVGPDILMPLLSGLAAILGAVLMCWQYLVRYIRRGLNFITRRNSNDDRKIKDP